MAKRGVALSFDLPLISVANRPAFQVNPTIALGDFQIKKDAGAFVNLTNLPTVDPAGSRNVNISLTATEMTADRVVVLGVDAAGNEWDMVEVTILPSQDEVGLGNFVDFGFYQNGAVWVDTVNGSPGTVTGVNGTQRNPVNNMPDANTLATALGLDRFELAPGSNITFAAAQSSKYFSARGATLNFGGQNIAGTTIFGALVSGTSTGAQPVLRECFLVGNSSFGTNFILDDCTLAGTITLPTGVSLIKDCVAAVLGGTPPILDFGAATLNSQVDLRKYAGHIEIQNLGQAGTDSLFMDSPGGDLTINANCVGGNVTIRGIVGLTNNGTGITFDVEQRTTPNTIQAKILTDATPFPGANVDAAISSRASSAALATVQSDTDDIQTRLPAALVGGRMDASVGAIAGTVTAADRIEDSTRGIVKGTVGVGSTTSSIVTSALDPAAAVTDQFKGRIVTFLSDTATAALRGQSTDITGNTSGGVLAVTALTTAPVSGDIFVIT